MAQIQISSNNVQSPKLGSVFTVTDYKHNISQLIQYLSKQPADAKQWETALAQLKIFTPKPQTWSFMSPLIRELSKILPSTAQQDCVLAADMGRKLLQMSKQFVVPQTGQMIPAGAQLVEEISFKIARFDTLGSKKRKAWNLFQSCRFPELEPNGVEITEVAPQLVKLSQIQDGREAIRLYLQTDDVRSAAAALEHLRLAVFYHGLAQNAEPSQPFMTTQPLYIDAFNKNGETVQFLLRPLMANDMSFSTIETLVVSLQAAPLYLN